MYPRKGRTTMKLILTKYIYLLTHINEALIIQVLYVEQFCELKIINEKHLSEKKGLTKIKSF